MKKIYLLMVIMGLLLAACNGGEDEAETPPDSAQLLSTAAQKLDEAQSFQFDLKVAGAPVLLDANNIGVDLTLAVQGANGVFVRPDALQGNVTISIDDIAAEVNLVVIGADQYLRHVILTLGNWQQTTFSADFDAGNLVSGETSIPNALRALEGVEYVGKTDLDGLEMHHLRGQLAAAKVRTVTVGLISTTEGNLTTDIYIRTSDGQLEQIVVTEPIEPDQSTTWTIGFYDYNGDYTVERPEVSN